MEVRRILMTFGGKNMKLINQHTVTQDYTTTLNPIYTAEIAPYITFGDYHKMVLCIFENNTISLDNKINSVFFSLAIEPTTMTTATRNGGMIRKDYTNIRDFDLSNDARCSTGTVVKIYEIDI